MTSRLGTWDQKNDNQLQAVTFYRGKCARNVQVIMWGHCSLSHQQKGTENWWKASPGYRYCKFRLGILSSWLWSSKIKKTWCRNYVKTLQRPELLYDFFGLKCVGHSARRVVVPQWLKWRIYVPFGYNFQEKIPQIRILCIITVISFLEFSNFSASIVPKPFKTPVIWSFYS